VDRIAKGGRGRKERRALVAIPIISTFAVMRPPSPRRASIRSQAPLMRTAGHQTARKAKRGGRAGQSHMGNDLRDRIASLIRV